MELGINMYVLSNDVVYDQDCMISYDGMSADLKQYQMT